MDITVKELQDIQEKTLENLLTKEEALADWLKWFEKRGERILKSAAAFGHSFATLDLPLELSAELSKPIHKPLLLKVKELLPGCEASIVEEEYEGKTVFRLEVAWN
jgi:hypothetical protein